MKNLEGEVPGGSVTGVAADFADAAQVKLLLAALAGVDILVNNAGLFGLKPFAEIPDEDRARYFDVKHERSPTLARAAARNARGRMWPKSSCWEANQA